jgi:hypothetical protein
MRKVFGLEIAARAEFRILNIKELHDIYQGWPTSAQRRAIR